MNNVKKQQAFIKLIKTINTNSSEHKKNLTPKEHLYSTTSEFNSCTQMSKKQLERLLNRDLGGRQWKQTIPLRKMVQLNKRCYGAHVKIGETV